MTATSGNSTSSRGSSSGSGSSYSGDYTQQAKDTASEVMQKGSEMVESGKQAASETVSTITETVREHPMAALATVAVFGLAVGALWRMRSNDTIYDRVMRQVPRNWRDPDMSWLSNIRWR